VRRTTGEENTGSVTAHKEELAARADPIDSLKEEISHQLKDFFSRILANLIMTGQIPAPTGDEKDRAKYVSERFSASGLEDIGLDSAGNVFGRLPGSQGRQTVGIFAALDTPFSSEVDHHLEVTETRVIGPGVAYDSLAASTLVSLAEFLVEGNMPIKDDILFVGLAKCSNQSDQEGMRVFLENHPSELSWTLMLESIGLGRLSYFSFGSLKFDFLVDMQQSLAPPPGVIGPSSAINVLADAVNLLLSIELPRRPKAVLNLGLIEGGESHSSWANKARLGAEIRSESADVLQRVEQEVDEIAGHLCSYYSCDVKLNKFGRRINCGLRFSHPMVRTLRRIMQSIGIDPSPGPDSTAGSLAMAEGIPTVTLGLTNGQRAGRKSSIEIEPLHKGLLQVLLALHRMGDVLS
jgi:acetylornithine deacetylase/succinyl-diaminopimelate desuccinylase-like protein